MDKENKDIDTMNDDNNEDQKSTFCENEYAFMDGHPGRELSHMQAQKQEEIPVIELPPDRLLSIKDLEIGSGNPTAAALEKTRGVCRDSRDYVSTLSDST